jgi:hypothetical protein
LLFHIIRRSLIPEVLKKIYLKYVILGLFQEN